MRATLVLVLAFNLSYVTTPLCGYNAYLLDYALAREQTAEITSPEVQYLNRNLPPGSNVLSVGDAELFYAEFPAIYNTVFDRSIAA